MYKGLPIIRNAYITTDRGVSWSQLKRSARDAGSSDNGFVRVKSNNDGNNNINYSPSWIRNLAISSWFSKYTREGVRKQSVAENLLYQLSTGKPFRRRIIIISTEYTTALSHTTAPLNATILATIVENSIVLQYNRIVPTRSHAQRYRTNTLKRPLRWINREWHAEWGSLARFRCGGG